MCLMITQKIFAELFSQSADREYPSPLYFVLQMSKHVGPVPSANVKTCWSCSYCKCLNMLVLFLLQMSKHVGPVPTANVYTCFGPVTTTNCTCWFCYYCKCLHVLVLFLPSRAGPVSTANVYRCWSGFYCKCLHMLVMFLL